MNQLKSNTIESLEPALDKLTSKRIFLVADSVAYSSSGAKQRLEPILAGRLEHCFSDFEPNPKFEHAVAGAQQLINASCDTVLTVGGGTALDMAKLICCFAAQGLVDNSPAEFFSRASDLKPRKHSLIAIPTTAGTGSEATQFAVVYADGSKHSVSHSSLVPDAVVLDPSLTYSVPVTTTTATGLDTVSQAIEAMWSVQSTPESIQFAERALQLGLEHLENVVLAPQPESRAAMLQASHLAGQAINISRTTAAHALSYTMTMQHQVPHGIAVALSLAEFIRFNGKVTTESLTDPRGMNHILSIFARLAKAFGVDSNAKNKMEQLASHWEQLLERLGVPRELSHWEITTQAERDRIIESVNEQRLKNNPRLVTAADLKNIVEEIA